MASPLPPLNPLRAFEATARRGSVSAAARELHVTHAAVSHQIKALEAHLGIPLFDRVGRRLKLTSQGATLLPAVSDAFEGIATATASMTRPATRGDLSIACVPALLTFWLLPKMEKFTTLFPEIRLTLNATNDVTTIHAHQADVAILYGDGGWSDCWVKHWTGLQLFPVISPTLANHQLLRSVRDIGNHVLLHADDGREWQSWFAAVDALDLMRSRHHFLGDARTSIEAALRGHGIAIGDSMTASEMLARGDLIIPFDRTVPAVDSFYVVCQHNLRSAPIVSVFIDWLYAMLEEDRGRAEPYVAARTALRKRVAARNRSQTPARTSK